MKEHDVTAGNHFPGIDAHLCAGGQDHAYGLLHKGALFALRQLWLQPMRPRRAMFILTSRHGSEVLRGALTKNVGLIMLIWVSKLPSVPFRGSVFPLQTECVAHHT